MVDTLLRVFTETLIFASSEVIAARETVEMLLRDFVETLILGMSEVMLDSDTVVMLDKVHCDAFMCLLSE
jgi:hypothetical protein